MLYGEKPVELEKSKVSMDREWSKILGSDNNISDISTIYSQI